LVLLGLHLITQRQAALALLVSSKPKPLEDPVLLPRLEALRQRAGVPPCSFKVVKVSDRSREVVAAFTGLGKRRKVVMSDTMVDTLDANEIEAIVAHELGHCAHGDVPRRMSLNLLLGILAFLIVHLLSIVPQGPFSGYRGLRDLAALPLVVLIVTLFSMVATRYVTRWHRKQELAADQFAFRVLPDLGPFISAMKRTMEQNLIGYSREEQSKFTHPAMAERVAAAEAFQRERDRATAAAAR
jgi:STE24 endopeptidase